MRAAVVIPVGAGREDNLRMCLRSIDDMLVRPSLIVLVLDGPVDIQDAELKGKVPIHVIRAEKHHPGMEQPRNIGVRRVEALNAKVGNPISHVWFLDSDIIVAHDALHHYELAMGDAYRILVGPYDWLSAGVREPMHELHNDPRWISFDEHDPQEVMVDDLSAGLACFSGNLVWPIDEFTRIGGFWDELHHGRCEDGELGLRAVACGVPISFVRGARGWHLDHPINIELTLERNSRDVPMLNARHPWVQGEGVFVVEEDGRRFNIRCSCGWSGNTIELWEHRAGCDGRFEA